MALVKCNVCGEEKYLESGRLCFSERCNPSRSEKNMNPDVPPGAVKKQEPVVSEPIVQLIEGEACPTCGQQVAKSGKTRQKEYRERQKSQ